MNVWPWIVVGACVLVIGLFLRATYRDVVKEAAIRWFATHDKFDDETPRYVFAYERRLDRKKGSRR